ALLAAPYVLRKAVKTARSRLRGAIAADRIGYFVKRSEAVGVLPHECANALDAGRFRVRRDVDEDQGARVRLLLADGNETRGAAQRRTDERRPASAECRERA